MRGYKNFEGSPHPGDLRNKIIIGTTDNVVSPNGYPVPTDKIICRVWADATDAGNQYFRDADTENSEQVVNFTIRYRDDVKPGMWVLFRKKKWNITSLGEYSFRGEYLGLKANLVTGVQQA
jgi:SPP1 family predicted phage head-tail adaptor